MRCSKIFCRNVIITIRLLASFQFERNMLIAMLIYSSKTCREGHRTCTHVEILRLNVLLISAKRGKSLQKKVMGRNVAADERRTRVITTESVPHVKCLPYKLEDDKCSTKQESELLQFVSAIKKNPYQGVLVVKTDKLDVELIL